MRASLVGVLAMLAVAMIGPSGLASDYNPYAGASNERFLINQHLSSPRIAHIDGEWQAMWYAMPKEHGRRYGLGFRIALDQAPLGDVELDDRGDLGDALKLFGTDRGFTWSDRRLYWWQRLIINPKATPCGAVVSKLTIPIQNDTPDGNAPFRVRYSPVDGYDKPGDFDGTPRCGKRMVEILENRDNLRKVTCVDVAYEEAESLSILEIALDPNGHPLWVVSPAPWGGMPYGTDYGATLDLMWELPSTCEPFAAWFPPRKPSWQPPPRANRVSAVVFEWAPTDNDLVSYQVWQDDRETGAYVLLHDDGKPATLGYRIDGEPHGLWTYFDPEARLVEARIYALGRFLMTLPIQNPDTDAPVEPAPATATDDEPDDEPAPTIATDAPPLSELETLKAQLAALQVESAEYREALRRYLESTIVIRLREFNKQLSGAAETLSQLEGFVAAMLVADDARRRAEGIFSSEGPVLDVMAKALNAKVDANYQGDEAIVGHLIARETYHVTSALESGRIIRDQVDAMLKMLAEVDPSANPAEVLAVVDERLEHFADQVDKRLADIQRHIEIRQRGDDVPGH